MIYFHCCLSQLYKPSLFIKNSGYGSPELSFTLKASHDFRLIELVGESKEMGLASIHQKVC